MITEFATSNCNGSQDVLRSLGVDRPRRLCSRATLKVRVGGGIRTAAYAMKLVTWGAEKIIIGSAAFHDGAVDQRFLGQLCAAIGKKRVIIALDTKGGQIVTHGWEQRTKLRPDEVIPQLEAYCSEFLCASVDNEGTMKGTNLRFFRALRRSTRFPVTAAGEIRGQREVRALEKIRMHAAVGMALYKGKLR